MTNSEKIALVVVLKDESHDITGWLAWHIAIGFSTIIVIDDESTDGTDWLVRNSVRGFDVRYEKVVQDFDFFYLRQQNEYKKALTRLSGEFSWVCFLDADEYLLLEGSETISDFLANFQNADGVALNWLLHGNNGHVLMPLVPAPVAYPKHSHPQELINHHVKSIVRPDRVGKHWHNVHCFDIAPDRYLDTEQRPIKWSSTPGIIETAPVFSNAWIMHFQSRSMEHFVERARKRRDTIITANTWNNEAWNLEDGRKADKLIISMFRILAKIELQSSRYLCETIVNSFKRPNFVRHDTWNQLAAGDLPPEIPEVDLSLRVFKIQTHSGTVLCLNPKTDLIVHATQVGQELELLYLIQSSDVDRAGLLMRGVRSDKPLRLRGDRQAGNVMHTQVGVTASGHATLRSPTTRFFLTAEPLDLGNGYSQVSCDRKSVQAWEMFDLIPLEATELDGSAAEIAQSYFSLMRKGLTASSFSDWLSSSAKSVSSVLLQTLLRQLTKSERTRLRSNLSSSAPLETLLNGSQYS